MNRWFIVGLMIGGLLGALHLAVEARSHYGERNGPSENAGEHQRGNHETESRSSDRTHQ